MPSTQVSKAIAQFEYAGKTFPVKIFLEKRKNCRVSISGKSIIMRFPKSLNKNDQKKYYYKFLDWVKTQLDNKPVLLAGPPSRNYFTQPELNVNQTIFKIEVIKEERKSYAWKRTGSHIRISCPENIDQKKISAAVGLAVGDYFKPSLASRVNALNAQFFQKQITKITIRNNKWVWGSCSNRGNLSFSSRIFFAPQEVLDYLIIHELAHLIHQNHSMKYWRLVESCMPDYLLHERWLKENGKHCFF